MTGLFRPVGVPGQTLAASKGQFSSYSNPLLFSPVFLTFSLISKLLISQLFLAFLFLFMVNPWSAAAFQDDARFEKMGRDPFLSLIFSEFLSK